MEQTLVSAGANLTERDHGGTGTIGGVTRESDMLGTIVLILVVLWFVGLLTSYTLGGFLHLVLVLAVAVLLLRVIQGRRTA